VAAGWGAPVVPLAGLPPELFGDLGSTDRALRGERQLIGEGDAFGDLEVGEPVAAVGGQVGLAPVTSHDHGGDPFAAERVGNAEHHRLSHVGMGAQDVLDVFGGDLLSSCSASSLWASRR
jgi:hypothetical protein